jgi:hypothetical protein
MPVTLLNSNYLKCYINDIVATQKRSGQHLRFKVIKLTLVAAYLGFGALPERLRQELRGGKPVKQFKFP